MTAELIVLLNAREIGRIQRNKQGKLTFRYDETWQQAKEAFPLSLSMPLALSEHGHNVVDTFLWGLLPDNEQVLSRWARKYHVSARNAFALVSNVGEDCAGAAQFVQPDRLSHILGSDEDDIEWLDESGVAERLRLLRADHSAWRTPRDTGQFSLAGAQPKTALLFEDGRWGVPSGRIPTTHILKPPTGEFDGFIENEHFCLSLARRLGMSAATSEITTFGDEIAIVVERYDRHRASRGLIRVHQEDACQALARLPTQKYENQGGPSARDIIELLRMHSSRRDEDVWRFLDALAFNWLVGGTDGHAKNYSLLIAGRGQVRLAPLYDLASALPYDDLDPQKLKLAMKVGRHYRLRNISGRNWQRLAAEIRLDADALLTRIEEMAERLPDAAATVAEDMKGRGLQHSIIARLKESLSRRADECGRALRQTPAVQ